MVRVLPRTVHSARGAHAVEAQRLGGTTRSWSKRQGDLPAVSAPQRCATMSQAGGLGTHDAVITMSDVTVLTHVTPMGDVTAVRHVGCAIDRASKSAASAAAPYEMAASKAAAACEMAASKTATPGVPATTASTPVAPATAASGAAAA